MPIYEFRCKKCNVIFERLCFPGTKQDFIPCPVCKGRTERVMSTFSAAPSNYGKERLQRACDT